MATYEFVMTTEDGQVKIHSDDVQAFSDAMDAPIIGFNNNPRQRLELQGQPKLEGYVGPCWGGKTHTGEPIIRYEDRAAYAALSL